MVAARSTNCSLVQAAELPQTNRVSMAEQTPATSALIDRLATLLLYCLYSKSLLLPQLWLELIP